MKQLKNKNRSANASLLESYSQLVGSVNNSGQEGKRSESYFEQFSLYEDSKYETHVSCSFDNVKL